jgi:SH3-like domain-containing protein
MNSLRFLKTIEFVGGARTLEALTLLVLLASCDRGPKRVPPIGEAFVGPHTLQLRSDVGTQSKVLATLHHGDRVEILQQRRRAVKVRTKSAAEGWVDDRQLLGAADMAELRELSTIAQSLPSQGKATTYTELNVHTQPVRQSPSFVQVKENGTVDVLLYRMVPRSDARRKPLIPPAPKAAKKAVARKPKAEPKVPPPPMPKPPGLPPDWLEISKSADPEEDDDPQPAAETAAAPPVPVERWSLVRMPNGSAGWVLNRLLTMAIPDDVAQYAEGKRIVAYFPLGDPQGEAKKYTWFWATTRSGPNDYDFDSFRVFWWNSRRGRYETSYINRNVTGFLPVLQRPVDWQGSKVPGFSLCLLDDDNRRIRKEFAFVENRVRSAGEQPCEAPPPATQKSPGLPSLPVAAQPPTEPKESALARIRDRVSSAVRGFFKR